MNMLAVKIATALITFTIGVWITSFLITVQIDPVINPVQLNTTSPELEMVFVLDTTGSMSGLIEGAKRRIWGIVNGVIQASPQATVRVGLVAYRDRGDDYVTQVVPLTDDLDTVYTKLMDYNAHGGGDEAEDVRSALADAVFKAGWSPPAQGRAQIMFLVGDAPPHVDYADRPDTLTTTANAVRGGMIVNTIQCGNFSETTLIWQAIAQRGQGEYFAIAQDGGVQVITTPYDEQLGELANKLGATFYAYGYGGFEDAEALRAEATQRAMLAERRVALAAPSQAKAERALNKAVNMKAYIGDLLQNIENGSVKLEDVNEADLPKDLQELSPTERRQEIEKRLAERREIRAQIMSLSKQRDTFIIAQRNKTGADGSGFDIVVAQALKEQMARKGIN